LIIDAISKRLGINPQQREYSAERVPAVCVNVRWGAGYERLGLTKNFVIFLRRHVTVMQSSNDRTVRERSIFGQVDGTIE
jgi:hypothetical protein